MNFDDFKRERDEALRSLDVKKLKAYMEKYDVPMPSDPTVWWAAIHKARVALTSLSEEDREISRLWLQSQNMTPGIRIPK